MLLLFALILRGVAFEFRGKIAARSWIGLWDTCLVVGSFVPALLLGVAFANIFAGIPIDTQGIFQGNLLTLLNPYGLAGGALFVLLFAMHGALWLATRTRGDLHTRAVGMAKRLYVPAAVMAVVFLAMTWFYTSLWQNLLAAPALLLLPLLAVLGLIATRWFLAQAAYWKAWFASALLIVGAVLFGVAGLYPNLLPSALTPSASLTVFNSASSPLTLWIMFGVVLCFLPVVIGYQIWVHVKFRAAIEEGGY
jgi:cytochrome d ubiquinol oxidase subunit II